MEICKYCVHFRTDGDCDGPEWQWCAIDARGRNDDVTFIESDNACRFYIYEEPEDDNW